MSEVKKISPVGNIYGWEESQFGEFVLSQDYDALAAEAQALREEVARAEQHRNDQADLIVSLRTEAAALRMARDDFKLERDLARQNFCDEQAENYQLQAHLKACLGELSELRARVVVPEGWTVERVQPEDGFGFIVHSPRHSGVRGETAVWSDAENPAERLLALMLNESIHEAS